MKKVLLALLLVLFISSVNATTIGSENVTIDLANSQVSVNLFVEELTSSSFSYVTSYHIQSETVDGEINGQPVNCTIEQLQFGTQINCPTDLENNFTVNLEFLGEDFTSQENSVQIFRYSQPIYRPTEEYRLQVILPRGSGILRQENVSTPVLLPENPTIQSNGRRIFVEWRIEPSLGETLSFKIMYEEFSTETGYAKIIIGAAIALLSVIGAYIIWRRRNREDIENLYGNLNQDQIAIIELLRENEGSMLQKDVVNESEYSKAKISGLVSELEEEGIIEKEKEGRSNKLKITRKYFG